MSALEENIGSPLGLLEILCGKGWDLREGPDSWNNIGWR